MFLFLRNCFFLPLLSVFASTVEAAYTGIADWPYDGAAGVPGSLAISKDDPGILGWATGFVNYVQGSPVSSSFGDPAKGLGAAQGTSMDVVTLGNGGQITLTFASPIQNGPGPDFAVFENGFADSFLELAWVEVSSDGSNFVRFPNFSFTNDIAAGGSLDPRDLLGYASKYRQGFGTAFDLDELRFAHQAAQSNPQEFSPEFQQQLVSNYGSLDLNSIRYVRLIDIIGDGSSFDASSTPFAIFDPLNSSGAAGFDLDAVAVLNERVLSGDPQTISFAPISSQRFTDASVALNASSSSGLPVSFEVIAGPAVLNGFVLSFTGLGQVIVRAIQTGDATYAPAVPVVQSFIVADELQHLYFESVANQLINSSVNLHVVSSSGLVPTVDILSGPVDASAGSPPNQVLQTGSTTGTITLRAAQAGGTLGGVTYAPAKDVQMTIEVVTAGAANAPLFFAEWQTAHSISGASTDDTDGDGVNDFIEYASGTDPGLASDRPAYTLEPSSNGEGFILEAFVSRLAPVRVGVEASDDLSNPGGWSAIVPEVESISVLANSPNRRKVRLKVASGKSGQRFWRFKFDPN